jgi:2-keto-4-pentenoate hydratase/2-oxohepta-3-ene-1,7-dioic acid hydratase in catechol pathway
MYRQWYNSSGEYCRLHFVTIQRDGYTEPGVLLDGRVVVIQGAGLSSLLEVIAGGADSLNRVRRWIGGPPSNRSLDPASLTLAAPIPRPPKLICIGLNYRDHAAEAKLAIPEVPTMFAKFPTSVIGPGRPIVLPRNSTKPDYEAEFAVVIGRRGRHVAEDRWRDYVFGYTILNDVSARDFQMATSQWMIGKTFDTFAPLGPAIVTADEIADPHNLRISLTINGETMQDSNTSNLIFKVPQLIAYLSSVFTLEPGDIIATGTPAGVGFARKPPRWLQPGDEVRIQIEGIGELVNPVVAEQ